MMDILAQRRARMAAVMNLPAGAFSRQGSLQTAIECTGTGLHSGLPITLRLCPAPAGTGIVFRRTDLAPAGVDKSSLDKSSLNNSGRDLPARHDWVVDTRHCTTLGHAEDPQFQVGTVEHVMAALAACAIDNAIVELDGPEVPIFDGSAAPFLFLIDRAGRVEQEAPRRMIELLRPVRVEDAGGFAELRPPAAGQQGLSITLDIDFPAAAIGRQALSVQVTEQDFRHELAAARTFVLSQDVAQLRAAGLALGGTLDNAVVVDGPAVLNPGGLRSPDEFVRHKALDVVGDMALAGAGLLARFIGHRTGHGLNNRLLRALFASPGAWRLHNADQPSGYGPLPQQAAAAPA